MSYKYFLKLADLLIYILPFFIAQKLNGILSIQATFISKAVTCSVFKTTKKLIKLTDIIVDEKKSGDL